MWFGLSAAATCATFYCNFPSACLARWKESATMRISSSPACASLFTAVMWIASGASRADDVALQPRLRRPVALALSTDGNYLYTANQRSGSVSVLHLEQRSVVREYDIGERLVNLTAFADGRLLAVDAAKSELLMLKAQGADIRMIARTPVSPDPVEAILAHDGRRVFVSSLWSHRLTEALAPTTEEEGFKIVREIDLPFPPRKMLLTPNDEQLLVADAFVGRIGVIKTNTGALSATREFPAHNIRGLQLTLNGSMVAVAHQMLNELAHTVQNDVHWGMLLSNDLRWLPLEALLAPEAELYAGAHMHPLGEAGRGGADPAALAMSPQGVVAVALGGANQVAIGKEQDFGLRRLEVGQRPTAAIFSRDGAFAYVANMFDDSISIIDVKREQIAGTVKLGPQAELSLADRGEMLFYDGAMSHDRWMSCHSCHTDGHTNGMLNDNFSDASFGAPKRVLSLLGAADTAPYAWNGTVASLDAQIRNSVQKTMQRDEPPSDEEVNALLAYLHTLAPPPSRDALRGKADVSLIARGQAIFTSQRCDRCHAAPTFTSAAAYDVGLTDTQGNREFNPPSLRGAGQRGPYFHDGRAATLADVFEVHGHQIEQPLPQEDINALTAYLRSL